MTTDCQQYGEEEPEQRSLFENEPSWMEHWRNMPRFYQPDASPFDSINVQFRNRADRAEFLSLIGYPVNRKRSIWYPPMDIKEVVSRYKRDEPVVDGRYPIYVISKGRHDHQLTSHALSLLGIEHYVVIEPVDEYRYKANKTEKAELLILPFSNLGQGSIPARNWVWDHAEQFNSVRHWILDDNIDGFYRLTDNNKTVVTDENPFRTTEEFVDRYANVGIAGLNYEFLVNKLSSYPPYYLNTRVYSCILILNKLRHRWRGRYNEDTDLCLRVLKDGFCTVLVNAYLAKKLPTMTQSGGNTEELYHAGGRRKMAESLVEQHPDITKIVWKWNRWQHHVDYSGFKQKLILKDGRIDEEIERIRREHKENEPAWMPAMAEADWQAERESGRREDKSA